MHDATWDAAVGDLEYEMLATGLAPPEDWPAPEPREEGVTPFGTRAHGRFLRAATLLAAARQGLYGYYADRHEQAALARSRRVFMASVQAHLDSRSPRGASQTVRLDALRYADRLRQWYYRVERAYKVRRGWVGQRPSAVSR